jgi:putative restriction endonuclease
VRAYVGVTDGRWYRFLADRPELTEVNFWRPGGAREFRTLSAGEPFIFKTHRRGRTREIGNDFPYDRVVGGGFFSGFVPLRLSEAWELFGLGNGVASLEQMRLLVGRYRGPLTVNEDPMLGCVLIRDTVFFPIGAAASPPRDFSPSTVQDKGYDLETEPATTVAYFQDLVGRLLGTSMAVDLAAPWQRTGPVYGDPRLAPQRLGQQAFQAVVLRAYQRRCAVTGDRIRPVLQAAHIRPLPAGGEHRLDNGLLLRSDVHTLYDLCTTAATWGSTRNTDCSSAHACGMNSATANSSTPTLATGSPCHSGGATIRIGNSWTGTWTRSFGHRDRSLILLT